MFMSPIVFLDAFSDAAPAASPLSALGSSFSWPKLIGGLVFSSVGFVAFVYGKKMGLWQTMALGFALIGYTYLMPNDTAVYLVGAALTVALFIFRD